MGTVITLNARIFILLLLIDVNKQITAIYIVRGDEMDSEKVISKIEEKIHLGEHWGEYCRMIDLQLLRDAVALLKEQDKEIKALRLLVEWAEECGFGFDQFHDEYERYKDEIKDMKYIDGMIHVAKRTLEDHGAFEEGR